MPSMVFHELGVILKHNPGVNIEYFSRAICYLGLIKTMDYVGEEVGGYFTAHHYILVAACTAKSAAKCILPLGRGHWHDEPTC